MTTPYEAGMRKIRRRWKELDPSDRKSDRGSSFGVYFQADELKALALSLSVEQARIKRLRKYVNMMENELALFDYLKSRDQLVWERTKLKKKGDVLDTRTEWPWNE